MNIFITHSVSPKELAIIDTIADVVSSKGATPIISTRDWKPNAIPKRIKSQIDSSACIIGIATIYGDQLKWLNSEITYSIEKKKPIILVADKELKINVQSKVIWIDWNNLLKTFNDVELEVKKIVLDRKIRNLASQLIINGLILLFLTSLKKE